MATNLPIHFWRDGHQSSHACRWRRPLMYFSIRRELPPIYFSIWDGMATNLFFYVKIIWERMTIYVFFFLGGDGQLSILHLGQNRHQSIHSLGSGYFGRDCYWWAFIHIFGIGWESICQSIWEGMASDLFTRKWLPAFLSKGEWPLSHVFGKGWPPIYLFIWVRMATYLHFYLGRGWQPIWMASNLHVHVWRHGNQSTH